MRGMYRERKSFRLAVYTTVKIVRSPEIFILTSLLPLHCVTCYCANFIALYVTVPVCSREHFVGIEKNKQRRAQGQFTFEQVHLFSNKV